MAHIWHLLPLFYHFHALVSSSHSPLVCSMQTNTHLWIMERKNGIKEKERKSNGWRRQYTATTKWIASMILKYVKSKKGKGNSKVERCSRNLILDKLYFYNMVWPAQSCPNLSIWHLILWIKFNKEFIFLGKYLRWLNIQAKTKESKDWFDRYGVFVSELFTSLVMTCFYWMEFE